MDRAPKLRVFLDTTESRFAHTGVHFQVGDDSGRPRFEVYQASVNYNEIMKQ